MGKKNTRKKATSRKNSDEESIPKQPRKKKATKIADKQEQEKEQMRRFTMSGKIDRIGETAVITIDDEVGEESAKGDFEISIEHASHDFADDPSTIFKTRMVDRLKPNPSSLTISLSKSLDDPNNPTFAVENIVGDDGVEVLYSADDVGAIVAVFTKAYINVHFNNLLVFKLEKPDTVKVYSLICCVWLNVAE